MTSVPLRLAAFAVVLVLSLGGGFVLGNVVGPIEDGEAGTEQHVDATTDGDPAPAEHGGSGEHGGGGGS